METCNHPGQYLHFHTKTLKNSKNVDVLWELVTRGHNKDIQGVDLIVKVEENLLLNLEKRYPVDSYILAFPGGICENDDVIGQCLKELKEETGYIGQRENVSEIGPQVYVDPWKSTEKSRFVSLTVDITSKGPQELESLEDIHPILIPQENLLENIQEKALENQAKIDSRLFAYALGKFYGSNNIKNE